MPAIDVNKTKTLDVINDLDMNLDHTVQTLLAPFYDRFPFLAHSIFGIPLGNLIAAIVVLLLFLLLRRFFTYIIMETLQRLTKHTETYYDDRIISALKGPVSFAFIVGSVLSILISLEIKKPSDLISHGKILFVFAKLG